MDDTSFCFNSEYEQIQTGHFWRDGICEARGFNAFIGRDTRMCEYDFFSVKKKTEVLFFVARFTEL